MKRVISVMVLALLMTEATGINDGSLARGQPSAAVQEKRRADVTRRLSRISVSSHVKVELTDDTKVDAFLAEVTADAITVDRIANRNDKNERRTIAIADIKKIEKARGRAMRILTITGVALLALVAIGVGSCAAAYGDMTPTVPAEHRP
ncbi:MAG TPA: hypothetical protein VM096_19485 [Vicinamibacterales bacterium]|nr:hypothetical protein [Vicinamibacterales bacterium]